MRHNVLPRPQLSAGALMWGSLYLAAVPSKNYPARTHQIVVDLRAGTPHFVVLDPQEGTGAGFWTAEDFTSEEGLASWCALIQLIDCD
ncbi:MAG TPA: hypothetical protein VK973_13265 [Arenicellales bacterium]|nr:hypothetical protein [Arenicellales bacterium]